VLQHRLVREAANGDRLYATVRGVSGGRPDGSLTSTGTGTVADGTGRFAGASGTAAYFDVVHITGPQPLRACTRSTAG
jgi:hypothetical protein